MSDYYKEKHLQATKNKIERVKSQQNFLGKHLWKVILGGVLFSFWAPHYTSHDPFSDRESLFEKGEYSFLELVLLCATVYTVFCLLYHFSSKYQDKKKLKELISLKEQLESELNKKSD